MVKLINIEKFSEIAKTDEILIIDFFAEWCGACNLLAPEYEKFSNNNPDINIFSADIDVESELTLENNVQAVPTILAFKNGKEIAKLTGYKSKGELEDFLKEIKK